MQIIEKLAMDQRTKAVPPGKTFTCVLTVLPNAVRPNASPNVQGSVSLVGEDVTAKLSQHERQLDGSPFLETLLKRAWRACLLVLTAMAAITAIGPALAADRPWLVEDSSNLRSFSVDLKTPNSVYDGEPRQWSRSPGRAQQGVYISPDDNYFFVFGFHGDVQRDVQVHTLEVYATHGVNRRLIAVTSADNVPQGGIAAGGQFGFINPRWDADGRGVRFDKFVAGTGYQTHRLDLASGRTERLVQHANYRSELFESRAGSVIASYVTYTPLTAPGIADLHFPMQWAKRTPGGWLVWGNGILMNEVRKFTATFSGGKPFEIAPVLAAAVAPDGRMASVFLYDETQSQFRIELLKLSAHAAPEVVMSVRGNGGANTGMFWSRDGQQLVVVGLGKYPTSEVSVYRVADRAWQHLDAFEDEAIKIVGWSEEKGRLTLAVPSAAGGSEKVAYQLKETTWSKEKEVISATSRSIEIHQSETEPPRAVIVERGRTQVLSEPDPALQGVHLSPMRAFSWRGPDGRKAEGGLVLPATYAPGQPVPIVIQPYYYPQGLFLPDGVSPTGDAAQSLAARGMGVLMMETVFIAGQSTEPIPGTTLQRSQAMEGAEFVRKIDALVDALVQAGITRADRAAISGFSRGGYLATYAMTHPARTAFAASAVNDSTTQSYQEYLNLAALSGTDPAGQYAARNRNPWQEPRNWLKEDVLLNADRIPGAILFSVLSPDDPANYGPVSLQTMGALIINHKPFDYLFGAAAVHRLVSPVHQTMLRHAVVDWMAFWMTREENVRPSYTLQNNRWRKMRDAWSKTQSTSISKGEPGFITTRSNMAYKLTTRKVGEARRAGDQLTLRYTYLGTGGAGSATRRESKQASITLGEDTLGQGDNYADQAGLKGLDECVRLLHPDEKAICIYPNERIIDGKEIPQRERKTDGSTLPDPDAIPHRYEVELIKVASSTPRT